MKQNDLLMSLLIECIPRGNQHKKISVSMVLPLVGVLKSHTLETMQTGEYVEKMCHVYTPDHYLAFKENEIWHFKKSWSCYAKGQT